MNEYQMSGLLAAAMTGATGEAMRRYLDRTIKMETDMIFEDPSAQGMSYRVGRLGMVRDIYRELENMKITNAMLEKKE